MPQASDELRQKIIARFGEISDAPVVTWLERHGWTLMDDWRWLCPKHKKIISDDERDAILFLIDEYDYGDIAYIRSEQPRTDWGLLIILGAVAFVSGIVGAGYFGGGQ